ncbi:MAG TPA: UDP-N-acetylmuramoyl-L-alanyl-D-glutamate--2,6-diaminopimelate ligase [Ilumatobacteraceae bacterium]|nr:UDP-N-acetylmuramoyl-L-alanyl-D-glutamate--2,6-diaminopimelate ligase [Ilumatobacteraceae bacterium]
MERLLGDLVADAAPSAEIRRGADDVRITGVEYDSHDVEAGSLYCCLRGGHVDGHDFAAAAVDAGAVALLVDRELPIDVAQVVVNDTRVAMGHFAAAFFGHPAGALTMVGVTGTNGKTTTTSLIASILDHAGIPAGLIGTLTGKHTTPESPDLQRLLAQFVADGRRAVVMEVSSHALALHRVVGCTFDVSVFTNLGRDHLDLHGTIERYFAAKAALFEPTLSERGVVNADDVHGRLLLDAAPIPMVPYSASELHDLTVEATHHSYTWRGRRLEVGIGGAFNAMNSLAAATASSLLGIDDDTIVAGLAAAPTVPGRFEPVDAGQPFAVIVDYAHTPDGLREALAAARATTTGNLIAVFGCGGDRDRDKRPQMGAVAAELADLVVVTSDNPRSEDPLVIIDAVMQGVPAGYGGRAVSEPDRRRAFAAAFGMAAPGDVVVIAGKGHETTQTIGSVVVPFDDRAVARSLLEATG